MAPRRLLFCCVNSWATSTRSTHSYTSFLSWPTKLTASLPFKNSWICSVVSPSPFCMRSCIRPQNAHPAHSIFMIIFHWKQVRFHDHLVLENSVWVDGLGTVVESRIGEVRD